MFSVDRNCRRSARSRAISWLNLLIVKRILWPDDAISSESDPIATVIYDRQT